MLKVNPLLNDESGIYFLLRVDENCFKYAYIGQAKKLLTRLASHMTGYEQHIDRSLKKHKLYDKETNPYGWRVEFMNFPESQLDEKEQYYIKEYANAGYQLRNVSLGGQSAGRDMINETRPAKGYRDGIKQGRKTMARDLKDISDKHLNITLKNPNNKVSQRMYEKFLYLLGGEEDELQG